MKIIYQVTVILIAGFLLTSCASLPATNAPFNQSLSWSTRAQQLGQVHSWTINGLIAIRNQKKSQSANVTWIQKGQDYTISIFGPLGIGGIILYGKPGNVTLEKENGEKFSAKTPEALIEKISHWGLPVSNLYYWIRGIPAPKAASHLILDKFNHLRSLNQQGWKISYQKYTGVNQLDLPSLLTLSRPPLFIKVIISHWMLHQA